MTFLFVGSHPDFLASGRPIVFGDLVDADELDPVEDAHLSASLVDAPASPAAPAPAAPAKPDTTTSEAK